ncbi:hypothetical protein F4782DRAFT_56499 [Xylaria castorea]|nr:hypothetical protein F4782DRAFT_56499 [Xylaria castorea]
MCSRLRPLPFLYPCVTIVMAFSPSSRVVGSRLNESPPRVRCAARPSQVQQTWLLTTLAYRASSSLDEISFPVVTINRSSRLYPFVRGAGREPLPE